LREVEKPTPNRAGTVIKKSPGIRHAQQPSLLAGPYLVYNR